MCIQRPKWNIDTFLVVIVLAGISVLSFKCIIVYPIKGIGGTDQAAAADMAVNLVNGKGFSNDYMQYSYFMSQLKYPEITHPEAHYPPLYSILIIPFFLILGTTAFAAKLPAILIGSIFLPVFLYMLTKRLSRSRVAGLAAGLSAMFFPVIFSYSLRVDDDLLFPFMVLTSCFFIIKAQDSPKFFYPAGVFIGLTYYAKSTGLLIIPAYFIFCVISGGFKILRSRKLWVCFAIVFLVMLPWFVRNTIHFRNPIFSTQQYAAGHIGYKDWEEGSYSLYWDKKFPSIFSKFKQAGPKKVWEKSKEFYKAYLWWAFVDINESWGEFKAKNFYTYYTGILTIVGLFLFFLSRLYFSFNRLFANKIEKKSKGSNVDSQSLKISKIHRTINDFLTLWHNQKFHVLWMVELFLVTFLAVCWEPIRRLAFPFVVINMSIGWTTYYVVAKQIFAKTKHSHIIASCLTFALMVSVLFLSTVEVYSDYKSDDFPYGEEDFLEEMEAGKWIKENLPGSVVMYREPGQLCFYSREKGLQIPLAELDRIIMVMKFYKVTHIIPQLDIRPSLKPLVEGKIPGLKLVYNKGLKIYEIKYDLLPSVDSVR